MSAFARVLVVGARRLEIAHGDLVLEKVDAIVNAANPTLLGGGGVDGAIHAAAGPALLEECRALGGCAFGDAKLTRGHALAARHVIHAVGPIYRDGASGEAELLARAYARSLEIAEAAALRSIAFPALSTGAYGYPMDAAARIALGAIAEHLRVRARSIEVVRMLLHGDRALRAHLDALAEIEGAARA